MIDSNTKKEIKNWCKNMGFDYYHVLIKMKRWVSLDIVTPDFQSMIERELGSRKFTRAATLDKMIYDYGEYEGKLKWKAYCDRQAYTNTKEYFIERYGEIDGEKKYNQICQFKTHNIENYTRLYGDNAIEKLKEFHHSNSSAFRSKSADIFLDIVDNLLTPEEKEHTYREYVVYSKKHNKIFIYDWVNTKLNLAIEYNGVYYHAKPDLYMNDDCLIFGKTIYEIWERDYTKMKVLFSERTVQDYKIVWQYSEPTKDEIMRWLNDFRNN